MDVVDRRGMMIKEEINAAKTSLKDGSCVDKALAKKQIKDMQDMLKGKKPTRSI